MQELRDWKKIVGRNIRHYRIKNKETQEALGEILGYQPSTIANYEKGDRLPDLITAYEIAQHYNIRMDDLMKVRES